MSSSSEAKQELDFFDMEKEKQSNNTHNPAVVASSSTSQFQKLFERRMSFHPDDQGHLSNINPLLLNTVISSDGGRISISSQNNNNNSCYVPLTTPKPFNMYPLFLRSAGVASGSNTPSPATPTSPLTIFYDGKISVFDVPHDMAERIIMVAENESSTVSQSMDSFRPKLLENLDGVLLDLPFQRKRSLQRFLEKRKERANPS